MSACTRPAILAAILLPLFGLNISHGDRFGAREKEASWGSFKGRIVWRGDDVPAPTIIPIRPGGPCGRNGLLLDETWVINPKDKGVRDVFLWLEDPNGEALPIHPSLRNPKLKKVTIKEDCCTFVPHAVGIRQGQEMVVKNKDPIPHNFTHSGNPLVNPGRGIVFPRDGDVLVQDLKADRSPIRFQCNIHPWMDAWVRVFDHPYFTVTGDDGAFEVKLAPAGNRRLKVWHAGSGWRGGAKGKTGQPIAIKGNAVTDLGELPINIPKASP